MMLTAAAWSISGQLTRWGMPHWLAYGLSLMFDGAGLICAEYARLAVERGTPAGLPRLSILAFASVSGLLNYSSGHRFGGTVGGAAFASTSFLVELLFELHRRDLRDTQRVARGLVPELLPRIPLVAWLLHPQQSFVALDRAIGVRLAQLDPVQHPTIIAVERADSPADKADATVRSAVRAALDTLPAGTSAADIAAHLTGLGIPTSPDTVRSLSGQHGGQPDSVVRLLPDDATISDAVRALTALGVTDPDSVLAAVRTTHGQDVNPDTVARILRRVTTGAAS